MVSTNSFSSSSFDIHCMPDSVLKKIGIDFDGCVDEMSIKWNLQLKYWIDSFLLAYHTIFKTVYFIDMLDDVLKFEWNFRLRKYFQLGKVLAAYIKKTVVISFSRVKHAVIWSTSFVKFSRFTLGKHFFWWFHKWPCSWII